MYPPRSITYERKNTCLQAPCDYCNGGHCILRHYGDNNIYVFRQAQQSADQPVSVSGASDYLSEFRSRSRELESHIRSVRRTKRGEEPASAPAVRFSAHSGGCRSNCVNCSPDGPANSQRYHVRENRRSSPVENRIICLRASGQRHQLCKYFQFRNRLR